MFRSILTHVLYPNRAEFDETNRAIKAAHQESERAKEAFSSKRRELQQRKTRAESVALLVDSDGEDLPLKEQLDALAVNDLEDAKAALEEAQQKVDSIIADPNVVRVYETKKAELEAAEVELDNLTSSREKTLNEMKTKLVPWEQALKKSVSDIDKRFSSYMRELGCTGMWFLIESVRLRIVVLIVTNTLQRRGWARTRKNCGGCQVWQL